MSKGERTKERLLRHGLELVSKDGLSQVSLGDLAKRAKLSKSGVFAHFGSAEGLQLELLDAAADLVQQDVLEPAMQAPPGLPRLRRFFDRLLGWTTCSGLPGGCPFVAASTEFDDVEGAVRDYLVAALEDWTDLFYMFIREAVEAGQLDPNVDAKAFAWQLFGLYTMHHTMQRLMNDADADRIALDGLEALIKRAQPE